MDLAASKRISMLDAIPDVKKPLFAAWKWSRTRGRTCSEKLVQDNINSSVPVQGVSV